MESPAPVEDNLYHMSEKSMKKLGIGTLPASLLEAIQLAEKSELGRKALGEYVFKAFIKNKEIEWDQYQAQVNDYELKRYLPVL